jgi:hypothetical protein
LQLKSYKKHYEIQTNTGKLSGKHGRPRQYGIDPVRLADYAQEIKQVVDQGVEVGIVIGGGKYLEVLQAPVCGYGSRSRRSHGNARYRITDSHYKRL